MLTGRRVILILRGMCRLAASAVHCPRSDRIPWIPKGGINVKDPWHSYSLPERRCCRKIDPMSEFNAQGTCHVDEYLVNISLYCLCQRFSCTFQQNKRITVSHTPSHIHTHTRACERTRAHIHEVPRARGRTHKHTFC